MAILGGLEVVFFPFAKAVITKTVVGKLVVAGNASVKAIVAEELVREAAWRTAEKFLSSAETKAGGNARDYIADKAHGYITKNPMGPKS